MKKWRFHTALVMSGLSLLTAPSLAAAEARVTMNGIEQVYDTAPYEKNDRVLVPMRAIFEALGARVVWEPGTQTVTATQQELRVVLAVGAQTAVVNGQTAVLDQEVEVSHDRVMVPIRFVSETLGAEVRWDAATQTVRVVSKDLKEKVLHFALRWDLSSADPARAGTEAEWNVLQQIYEGLVRLEANGVVQPGAAREWRVTPDGTHYTFYLRNEAKWSDGSAVTARDFEYAWKRVLDPMVGSPYSFLLYGVQGAEAYNSGTGTADEVSIRATDDHTLEIALTSPQTYFLRELAFPTFYPVKRSFVEGAGKLFGTEAAKTLSNGPFRLQDWNRNKSLLLVKNKSYRDNALVKLEQVDFQIHTEEWAAANSYQEGLLDAYTLGSLRLDMQEPAATTVKKVPSNTVSYLVFNEKVQALQNPKIRRALTYAIDAQAYSEAQYGEYAKAATGFVPDGVSDGSTGWFRDLAGDALQRAAQAARAKSMLQEGLREAGLIEVPTLKLLLSDSELSKRGGEFIKKSWHDRLGLEVEVEYARYSTFLKRAYVGDYDITIELWNADYDDPESFLELWQTGQNLNVAGYSNPQYDDLLKQAHKDPDTTHRMKLLIQAERLLLDDMAVGPLSFRSKLFLNRPYVKGVQLSSYGPMYDLKEAYISGKN